MAAGGVTAYAAVDVSGSFHESAVDIGGATPPPPPPLLGAFEGGFTMLVVGTDNDAKQGDDYGERSGTLNDVTILLHVSADHRNAVAVSFPRDLVIPHPECTDPETGEVFGAMSAQPLNDAYGRGGLGCVVATISNLTSVPIAYAAATSFNGVIEMTNAVGGVEVCATEPIVDEWTGLDLPAGRSTVSGQSALAFLRTRHAVGDGSDLARIGSQQQYLSSLLRTIKSSSTLTDPVKLYGLAQAAAQNITPSTTLESPDSLVSLALTMKDIDLGKVVFVQYPVTAWVEDANKVQPLYPVADELFDHILTDQPFALPAEPTASASAPADGEPDDPGPAGEPTEAISSDAPSGEPGVVPDPEDGAVIEGLSGQKADDETCASGFSG